MRALADSLTVDMTAVGQQIARVPGVHGVDRFASADVIVSAPGTAPTPARLFAVDPAYLDHHPEASLVTGTFQGGTALTQPLRELPGFPTARTVTIALPVAAQAPPPPAAPAPASDEAGPVEPPPP